MASFNNAMEVFRLLPKTNCRKCGESTCLAFAGAVFIGKSRLSDCPYVPEDKRQLYGVAKRDSNPIEEQSKEVMQKLQQKFLTLDLEERAGTIGAEYRQEAITIPILGKPFSIDQSCKVTTDLHVNSWVLGSALNYINNSQGVPLSSNWVPLRELPSGKDWYRLFGQQCENVLKATADQYPELFSDLVEMFQGTMVDDQFKSDVAVILQPFPCVPMLICYWLPEEGMESSLNLFFDDTAEANMGIEGLYTLGVGIAQMLERMAKVHGESYSI